MKTEIIEQINNLENQLLELQNKRKPKRYQDKREHERKIRDLQIQIKKLKKPLKSIKQSDRIPFRLDEWNKKVIMWIKENRIDTDKYRYIIDLIGGIDNLNVYIQWYKSKHKTAEQLTSLHVKDIKVVINNYISNQNKTEQ